MTAIEAPLEAPLDADVPATIAARLRSLASLDGVLRTRIAFAAVVILAGILYTWNLTVSGYANTYYAAAAQAASQSWSAFFFGSLDAANFITVDKPPLATWLMGLSVRLFGLNSWAILLPEALAGVATVAVLFTMVRRTFGTAAATIAGLVMALTPAAVLIFRYNNPDALLTLLLVSAAWALSRGLEAGRLRWPIAAAVLVGLAFLTKYLQAYLVLPAFAAVWLVAAPVSFRRRLGGLLAAGLAVLVSSGWWVAIVELIPAANRPYIGGSQTNSAVELLLGYDGLGRLFGMSGPSGAGGPPGGGGGPGGGGFSGEAGILRLFNDQFGGQIAWFIPLALLSLGAGLWIHRRASRTDQPRAAYLLWGLWLGVHIVVFSFMSGIIHTYYAVAVAPAIAALVGAGVVELWRLRSRRIAAGLALAAGLAGSGWLSWQLLQRTPEFAPGLGLAAMAIAIVAAVIVALPARIVRAKLPAAALILGLTALLAGPLAYTADTVATAYSGGDPAAGPAVAGTGFGGGGRLGGRAGFGDGNGFVPGNPPVAAPDGSRVGSPGTGPAGLASGPQENVNAALIDYLLANRGSATWIVAVASANQAGAIQLAAGQPVMAMGGFSGSDPAPTLEQLQAYVRSGQLRFVMAGGGGPGGGGRGSDVTSARATWLAAACTVVNVGGATLYDCAGAA